MAACATSHTEHGDRAETPNAARRLRPDARPSRRRLAASGRRRRRLAQSRTDEAHRGDRRARQVRHVLPGRRLCHGLRRASFDHRQVRAADAALGAGHGHEPAGPRRHGLDHLRRALSDRPLLRLARPSVGRPRGLERRDHRLCQVRRGVRPPASAACRALCHGRGVRRGLPHPVGQLGRRRLHRRQEGGRLRAAGQPARARLQGKVLHRRRRPERAALAAGPSGADPGRLLGSRASAGVAHRRRRVHRAERPRRGAGLLSRL